MAKNKKNKHGKAELIESLWDERDHIFKKVRKKIKKLSKKSKFSFSKKDILMEQIISSDIVFNENDIFSLFATQTDDYTKYKIVEYKCVKDKFCIFQYAGALYLNMGDGTIPRRIGGFTEVPQYFTSKGTDVMKFNTDASEIKTFQDAVRYYKKKGTVPKIRKLGDTKVTIINEEIIKEIKSKENEENKEENE